MRLQLRLLSLSLLSCIGCGAAPSGRVVSVDVRGAVYQDTDHTTISTATTAVRARPSAEVTLSARHVIDVTTTASVDVISAATDRWEEARNEILGGVGYSDGTVSLDAAYTYSGENDWWSHAASAGGSVDLDDHRVTLSLGGSYGHNDVGRSGDANFHREMHTGNGRAAVVWVATPDDLWSVGYDFGAVVGYQESPYRYARFTDPVSPILQTTPESVPDLRLRHAVTVRWNHALSPDIALRSHLRGYGDDWGVLSITGGTELRGAIGQWELGVLVRGYAQLGAAFFSDVYDTPQRYMTSDRELSPFWDVFGGPVLGWRGTDQGPFSELRFEARVTGFGFQFLDYARLPDRFGFVAELAIGGSL